MAIMRQPSGCASLLLLGTFFFSSAGAAEASDLIQAVQSGDRALVRVLLQKAPDVNVAEPDGTTALHWAVRADDAELIQLLLDSGASPTTSNRYGVTPLALAATNGSPSAILALLKAGANPNTRG